ncbi:MAG: hypothetical protein IBX55_08940 [Methyloprofundus sp.]|nr:hypothetical protein [Methyloprofundus sp.]
MKIETKIQHAELETPRFIQSNTYRSYHFVPATFLAEIDIDGESHQIVVQNGNSYDFGDYNMPSNYLSMYEDASSELLATIDSLYESELDVAQTLDINAKFGTDFSIEEVIAIKTAINDLIIDTQQIVHAKEREADEELKADDHVYVLHAAVEEFVDDEGGCFHRQCSSEELIVFESDSEADEFLETIGADIGYIISKEVARDRFPEVF